jgi:hypothetical protein
MQKTASLSYSPLFYSTVTLESTTIGLNVYGQFTHSICSQVALAQAIVTVGIRTEDVIGYPSPQRIPQRLD